MRDEKRYGAGAPRPFLLLAAPLPGFPYAPADQARAFVEGDVHAYVQPELSAAVPARVEVERVRNYLSDASQAGHYQAMGEADRQARPAENMA